MGLKSKPAQGTTLEVRLTGGDAPSEAAKGAMIDVKSMADYRNEFENLRMQNGHASEAEILHRVKEYITRRIDGMVDEACKKRIMDLTTVALSVASSTVIPFSGVAVVVAATVMQCLNFSVTLGLIPLMNVRSFSDLTSMSSQIGNAIKRASKSGLMAGVETAVLEILSKFGLGDWLWTEIIRDILVEMIGDSAMDAAWIMTPVLAAPKYMLHRRLIKKMYRKLGNKAHVVHHTWTEQNCVQIEAQATVVAQVQVDAYGNVQGTYLQAQEVSATQAGAQVSQTSAYFQPQNGGMGLAQVSHTDSYFQPQTGGAGEVQVSQTDAYFQPQKGGAGQVQVSQTNAYMKQHSGGAAEAQVSQAHAYFQPEVGGAGQTQVSQTDAYFQQRSGGAGDAQVSHPSAYFQPPREGPGQLEVSQTNAHLKQQGEGAGQAPVSQTHAYFQAQEGGAGDAQVSQTNSRFQSQREGAGEAQVSQTNACFLPQKGGAEQAHVSNTHAYFQSPSGGKAQAPMSQPSAHFQQQAPPQPQWPAYSPSSPSPYTNPAPGMVPGHPQVPMQPASNSNPPPKRNATLIMGYSPPKNSSFFQPQFQPQALRHNPLANSPSFQPQSQVTGFAAAAAQTYSPPPNPTHFQQPYGSQQTYTMYSRPQGNSYVQMGDYNKPQAAPAASSPGRPQGNPYVQMGDYNKPQAAPAASSPGRPQGNPYVQMGDYNKPQAAPAAFTPGYPQFSPSVQMGDYCKMQTPMAYPQTGNPLPGAEYQASAPPPDLWYQRQAN